MNKAGKMMAAAALVGAGIVGFNMYKKKNPDAINNVKHMAKNAASTMLTKIEEMD